MASYLINITQEETNKNVVDDLSLNKLTTRKVNKLRQRENRAKIIEKTRKITDESEDDDNDLSPTNHQQQQQQQDHQQIKQTEHIIQQEISKFKRRSIKLNETKKQNETNKLIGKINNIKTKLKSFTHPPPATTSTTATTNIKLLQNQNKLLASSVSSISSINSIKSSCSNSSKFYSDENNIQRKPTFRFSKINYDDKYLYQRMPEVRFITKIPFSIQILTVIWIISISQK